MAMAMVMAKAMAMAMVVAKSMAMAHTHHAPRPHPQEGGGTILGGGGRPGNPRPFMYFLCFPFVECAFGVFNGFGKFSEVPRGFSEVLVGSRRLAIHE